MNITKSTGAAFLLSACLAAASPTTASEQTEHDDAEPHGERHEHPNHAALFVGLTSGGEESKLGREENALTVGIEYERRLNHYFGIGALADFVIGGERREGVLAVPVFFHAGRSTFLAALGFEQTGEHLEHDANANELLRLGYMFNFHVQGVTVAPAINVDIVEDEQLIVFGVNLGRGF